MEGPTKSVESAAFSKIILAPSPENCNTRVKLGVRRELFNVLGNYEFRTQVGQFSGIVQHGLTNARHAFRGVKRGLYYAGDMGADRKVIVYTWRPPWDFVWVGSRFKGYLDRKYPPPKKVFAVLVQQEKQPNPDDVYGSIEHWNWVREAPDLQGAPVDWADRYDEKLWSRQP